jgi:hypothetical protein
MTARARGRRRGNSAAGKLVVLIALAAVTLLAPHVLERGATFIAHGLGVLAFAAADLFNHLLLEPLAEQLKHNITNITNGTGPATASPTPS